MKHRWIKTSAIWTVLLGMGSIQMISDLLDQPRLRNLGLATGMSPAIRAFSTHRSLETFAIDCFLEWTDPDGRWHTLILTPEIYRQLAGPYNRRNVYGTALAYGPILAIEQPVVFESVVRYALCGNGSLQQKFGMNTNSERELIRIRYEPITGTDMNGLPRQLEVSCP